MGRRSGAPETDDDVEAMPLAELNDRIGRLEYRTKMKVSASLKRSSFKKLAWLEEQRERIHGIPAPKRKFRLTPAVAPQPSHIAGTYTSLERAMLDATCGQRNVSLRRRLTTAGGSLRKSLEEQLGAQWEPCRTWWRRITLLDGSTTRYPLLMRRLAPDGTWQYRRMTDENIGRGAFSTRVTAVDGSACAHCFNIAQPERVSFC
jgi:hypothetical protein